MVKLHPFFIFVYTFHDVCHAIHIPRHMVIIIVFILDRSACLFSSLLPCLCICSFVQAFLQLGVLFWPIVKSYFIICPNICCSLLLARKTCPPLKSTVYFPINALPVNASLPSLFETVAKWQNVAKCWGKILRNKVKYHHDTNCLRIQKCHLNFSWPGGSWTIDQNNSLHVLMNYSRTPSPIKMLMPFVSLRQFTSR